MSGSKGMIFLVEDDPSWRDLYAEILSDEGYTVQVAATKKQALDMIARHVFDIAVIDLKLVDHDPKDLGGIEVVESLHNCNAPTRIIVRSGYLTPEINHKLNELGVRDILDKQAEKRELLDIIARLDHSPV